jgi:hypothetical protein
MSPEATEKALPPAKQAESVDPSRWVEVLPLGGLVAAVALSAINGFPTGLIVIGATVLLVGVWNLWVSLQLVAGDRPAKAENGDADAPSYEEEQKAFLLRALEDLEFERSVGKIDDEDYRVFRQQYRARAKQALEAGDHANNPLRKKAESMALAYLEDRGLGQPPTKSTEKATEQTDRERDTDDGERRGKS